MTTTNNTTTTISGTINSIITKNVFSAIASNRKIRAFERGEGAKKCYAELVEWYGNFIDVDRDIEFANTFNKLAFNETELESVIVGKLRIRLRVPGSMRFKYEKIDVERAKIKLIFSFLRSAASLGYLIRTEEMDRYRDEHNNLKFSRYFTYSMVKNPRIEKHMLKGIHTEPGALGASGARVQVGTLGAKYGSAVKKFSRRASSKALRVARIDRGELLSLVQDSDEYKEAVIEAKKPNREGFAKLRDRYNVYIDQVVKLMEADELFLSNWFDSRFRMYYILTHPLLNPQGGGANKYLWETAHSYTITEDGMDELIWAATVLGRGRRTKKKAIAYWHRYESLVRDALLNEKNQAKLFYNKRLLDTIDVGVGSQSHFLLWFDFTSGGIQHASVAFHDKKGLEISNAGRCDGKVGDPHTENAKMFKLTRDDAKKLMQPVMHGQSEFSFVNKTLPSVGLTMDTEEANLMLDKALGKWHRNAKTVARFGVNLYTKANPTLIFSAPDGQRCLSTAVFKSCTLSYDFVDIGTKSGLGSVSAYTADLPFATVVINGREEPIFNEDSEKVTVAGLYANIIHAIDGYTLRQIDAYLYVHDNFAFIPGSVSTAIDAATKVHCEMFERRYFDEVFNEILDRHSEATVDMAPELIYGDATVECIKHSDGAFLMP